MSDKYKAHKYYNDVQWSVVDQQGAILYEAMFDSLDIAAYVAKRHSENDDLTWEDIESDVKAFEAQQPTPAASVPGTTDVHMVTRSRIADYVAEGNLERVWDVIEGLQAELGSAEYASSAVESQVAYLSNQVIEAEAELARVEAERDAARLERDRMVCAVLFWNAQDGESAADRAATTAMHEMADTLNMKYRSCVNVYAQASAPPTDGD